jgi:Fe(3+) dicitrate transport protein
MQAVPGLELIDNNLKDAHGINSDIGLRGFIGKWFYVDMSLYTMQYNNRIGRLSKYNEFNQLYTLKTNVGNNFTSGFESIVELDILAQTSLKKKFKLPFFVSYTFNNARYQHFIVSDKNLQGITTDKDLYNNYVENAPRHILRSGLNFALLGDKELGERLNLGLQFSTVSEVFNDALNTIDATANGQNGKIPAYSIYDLNVKFQTKKNLYIKLTINNLTNSKYFTRRAGGYPGPGVMPSDGRSILVTLDVKI